MNRVAGFRLVGILAVLMTLAACSGRNEDEVRGWMEGVRKDVKPIVTPISEPKKFIPFGYVHKDEVDPFNPNKLLIAIARSTAKTKTGPVIDQNRVKELLEGVPLDSLKMVGTLEKKGVYVALIQNDKNIYQVRLGNYLGQNHGKITKITETEVELKEIIQDATGDNVEHEAKLELQESKNDRSK